MRTDMIAPVKTTQSISTLKINAISAAMAIIACGKSHGILLARWKATDASSPTNEHNMPLTAILKVGELLNLS
jgi:hypothetical protein